MRGSKVLPFTIPKSEKASITVQRDRQESFYGHLHQHPETQLSLIISGSGTLFCGNTLIPFQPDSLICVRGDKPHLFRSEPTDGEHVERISIFFLESWWSALCELTPEISRLQMPFQEDWAGWYLSDVDLSIFNLMDGLDQGASAAKFEQFVALISKISRQKVHPIRESATRPNYRGEDSDRMSQIIEYTMNNYQQPIYLADIADKIALTPSSFCKYFKKRTGKSYVQFLNEIRCEAARNLLSQELELSMPEIALKSGYNSMANFNRQFKKYQGMSPSNYRKVKVIPTLDGVSY
ncbi:AraC family transcriptional regulator [Gilvibacter sediminis]|uniref:AraC family transcriptional regulator n=1 Tax=Gilvibacter sediminis TaxID=379071 RepID=UPI00234FFE2F|nr:AraC family transcriptional regulator [Gilvibacter sediminis]MDC7997280.1 AraC family transcriptional regulator [Gilvibacter sediminis]